jgi:enoyl-CoA hydratase/carnithine racemase
MPGPVSYRLDDSIATITMDDGKVNALSLPMLSELNAALDQACSDHAVVVVTGRPGVFSAGFDLSVLRSVGPDAVPMLQAGFLLAERILSFPTPVVIACPGHAIAMGVFLVLSGDYRIGVTGPYKLTANEVAIGLTMPRAAVEICRQRLVPAAFDRAVILAEPFSPRDAVGAGFLDQVVEPAALEDVARGIATQLATLDMGAHARSKLRARSATLGALRLAIEADDAELVPPV